MAGHDQCRSAAAGHRNDAGVVERACKIFEEIEVTIALAMALWSIATGPRATRAGSFRAGPGSLRALRRAPGLVDGAPASGRRQAPGCAVHREKAVQRSRKGVQHFCAGVRAPRARAHQQRPQHHAPNVFTACDQDYHVAGGSHVALLRYRGAHVEGAVTRARDSARPAARRPGPRGRAGPVSVLRRPQRRLRGGERVRFYTNCPGLAG